MKSLWTMKMKIILTGLVLSLFILVEAQAQKSNDNIWQMGYNPLNPDTTLHTPDFLRTWGFYYFDFSENEMRVLRDDDRPMGIYATNAMYCNDAGRLMLYTNGQYLLDSADMIIPDAERVGNYYPEYWEAVLSGYLLPQGALLLPWPGTDSIVLLTSLFNIDKSFNDIISYTIIDNENNSKYILKDLDELFVKTDMKSGKLVTCRHANGRDWWLTIGSRDGTKMYVFIIEKSGFRLVQTYDGMIKNDGHDLGQSAFSPDGNKFGTIDMLYWDSMTVVSTFDFDRCTGTLSNYQHDTIANYRGDLSVGAVFSPSSRYFYAVNDYNLYQYDMQAPTLLEGKKIVAEYDGFINSPSWPVETGFGVFAPGPDGRLYNMTGQGTSRWAHRMDDPDEGGTACNFRQHILTIPNQSRCAPNFPNYRLGPLDGSSCDTLGLDNHPIAKYRYEPDSIDYKRLRFTDLSYFRPEIWSWDLGDGSPKSQLHIIVTNRMVRTRSASQ